MGSFLDGSVRDGLAGAAAALGDSFVVIAGRAELVLAAPAPADPQDAIEAWRVVARACIFRRHSRRTTFAELVAQHHTMSPSFRIVCEQSAR